MKKIIAVKKENKEEVEWLKDSKWLKRQSYKYLSKWTLKRLVIMIPITLVLYNLGINLGILEAHTFALFTNPLLATFLTMTFESIYVSHGLHGLSTDAIVFFALFDRKLYCDKRSIKRLTKILRKNKTYQQSNMNVKEYFDEVNNHLDFLNNKKEMINKINPTPVSLKDSVNYSILIGDQEYKIDNPMPKENILSSEQAIKDIDKQIADTEEVFDESVESLTEIEDNYIQIRNVSDALYQLLDGTESLNSNINNLNILVSNRELLYEIYTSCKDAANLPNNLQDATKEDLELFKRKILFIKLGYAIEKKIENEQRLALAEIAIEEVEQLEKEKSEIKPMELYYKNEYKN